MWYDCKRAWSCSVTQWKTPCRLAQSNCISRIWFAEKYSRPPVTHLCDFPHCGTVRSSPTIWSYDFEDRMTGDHSNNSGEREGAALDRRRFVRVGATSLGVAGLGACVFGFRYLSPNVLYEPSPIVSVGRPERYTIGSVTLDPRFGILVVRDQEGYYALSAVCAHLGCLTIWKGGCGRYRLSLPRQHVSARRNHHRRPSSRTFAVAENVARRRWLSHRRPINHPASTFRVCPGGNAWLDHSVSLTAAPDSTTPCTPLFAGAKTFSA